MDATEAITQRAKDVPIVKKRCADLRPSRFQVRKDFDQVKLEALAASIAIHGLQQPIVVRYTNELIFGERRLRAHILLNLEYIDSKVIECTDREAASIATAENLKRVDLLPSEKAAIAKMHLDLGCTVEEIASEMGYTTTTVKRYLEISGLDLATQSFLDQQLIRMQDLDTLFRIPDQNRRIQTATVIAREQLTPVQVRAQFQHVAPVRVPRNLVAAPEPARKPRDITPARIGSSPPTRVPAAWTGSVIPVPLPRELMDEMVMLTQKLHRFKEGGGQARGEAREQLKRVIEDLAKELVLLGNHIASET